MQMNFDEILNDLNDVFNVSIRRMEGALRRGVSFMGNNSETATYNFIRDFIRDFFLKLFLNRPFQGWLVIEKKLPASVKYT